MSTYVDDVDHLPRAEQSEEAVLASCMVDDDVFDIIRPSLTAADFRGWKNAAIWRAILKIGDEFGAINAGSVADVLEQELPGKVQWRVELDSLIERLPAAEHAEYHVELIRKVTAQRHLIALFGKLTGWAYEGRDTAEIEAAALAGLTGYELRPGGLQALRDLAQKHAAVLDRFEANPQGLRGVSTGFPLLDSYTRGFRPGELIIIGARPSTGKTQLALTMAQNAAKSAGPVGIFSLEMDDLSLLERIYCQRAGIDPVAVLNRGWQDDELDRFRRARRAADQLGLFIDDTPGLTTAALRGRVQRFMALHQNADKKPALLVADYLDLFGDRDENEVRRRGVVTKTLRNIAREFGLPVILLCQLNREATKRENERPKLADLRASGEIEQDADTVLLLWRNPNKPADQLTIILAKQRQGPQNVDIDVRYIRQTGQIGDKHEHR